MFKGNGFDPVIIPPDVDEAIPAGIKPHNAVMFLALKKALYAENIALAQGYTSGETVVAADTTVVCGGCMIGKPADKNDASFILKTLRGRPHTVLTGVAMLSPGTKKRRVFYDKSEVCFTQYTDNDIEVYINTSEPYDKAGGYAVQGAWGKYIGRVEGDLNNVIGFPLALFLKHLKDF